MSKGKNEEGENAIHEERDGWKEVRRGRKGAHKLAEEGGMRTLFVDNLPEDIQRKESYELFGRWGRVVDIFISRKKMVYSSARFAFVRVESFEQGRLVVERTNGRCFFDKRRIAVKIADFAINKIVRGIGGQRGGAGSGSIEWRGARENSRWKEIAGAKPDSLVKGRSFLDVAKGLGAKRSVEYAENGREPSQGVIADISTPSKVVKPEDIFNTSLLGRCSPEGFLKMPDGECLVNGRPVEEVRKIGGLWVLLQFRNKGEMKECMEEWNSNDDNQPEWLEELRVWESDFVVSERIVWLKCVGLPLMACKESVLKLIGNLVGQSLPDVDKGPVYT